MYVNGYVRLHVFCLRTEDATDFGVSSTGRFVQTTYAGRGYLPLEESLMSYSMLVDIEAGLCALNEQDQAVMLHS